MEVHLDTESIIMPNIGNCGEIYYVNQEILPYKHNVLGPNAILVRSENQNNKFLSVSFLSDDFQRKLKMIVSPNGQTKFNKTELKTLDVIIPSVKEQIKVGTLFDSLDSLITLHQRKYDKLVNVKKSLLEKMFPQNGESIPRLRFKGFTDAWEQCKLSQFYDFSKGKGLSLNSFYEGKDSLGIAYGHLYTKYTEVINKVNLSTYDDNGVLSRKGDLLFPGSSTVPFGTAQSNAIMLDNVKLGGDVIIARAKDLSVYAPFVSYQINAQRSKLFPITVGTTITHMYGKDIANIEYMFPKFDEQEKIGRTLDSLDSLITLHQRKYEKLQNIKKHCFKRCLSRKEIEIWLLIMN